MGRKEDEEDQGKVSKDTNGSRIEELTKKCKPLNVQLSRLELPKNGVILIKDDSSGKFKNLHVNSNDAVVSNAFVSNVEKGENEDNSNDTAETIKKIKEFIALGRCEDNKKDQESSDKKVGFKSKVVTKRKLLNKKSAKNPSKKLSTCAERSNAERELERTLKGQDSTSSASDLNDFSGASVSDGIIEKKVADQINQSNPIDFDECTTTECIDNPLKNELLTTPSRVSKRIQSKSVKFSVKKMLRGDDVNVLKRMIPGYQDNTPSKKERLTEKKPKTEIKKPSIPVKVPNSPSPEPNQEKDLVNTPPLTSTSTLDTVTSDTSITSEPSPELTARGSTETLIENKEKLVALSDKIGKFAIGNGKITVELKGSQQKKVVRIALPPSSNQVPLPNTSLGPDIIIKRVKPVKKTVVMPDNPALGMKGIIEKEVFLEHTPPNNPTITKDSKMSPRVNLERITTPKLKENLLKMQKNILRQGRNDKKHDKEVLKEVKSHDIKDDRPETTDNVQEKASAVATAEGDIAATLTNELAKISEAGIDKSSPLNPDVLCGNVDQALLTESSKKVEKSVSLVEEEPKKPAPVEKTRGRKTAKVTPLTQVKPKTESVSKKPLNKVKKPETVSEKVQTSDELELIEPEKETYKCLFDRYFSTRERYVEHHDSLDSDSSEDFNDEIYAHFINLRRKKEVIGNYEDKKDGTVTMYDLMQDIALELPTWNIHVASDGQAFCLAQVDIVDNVPVMKKVIEIDLDYNAKVFVGGTVMPEFEGNYSGYEDIRQLIYDVDQL